LAVGCVWLMAWVGEGRRPLVPHYKDRANLAVYLDDRGRENAVVSAEDWARRRAHILVGMKQAMGPLPSRINLPRLNVRILETASQDGITRHKISFTVERGDRVTAYLFIPPAADASHRFPAMLALHPTSPLGKGAVADPAAGGNYGLELAQRGYIVLAPDYPSFGDYPYDFTASKYGSGSIKGIFNHMRCVDLLVARPDVAPEQIGVIGHSLGGHNAMFVGVFDERLKVVVSSCGWTPFRYYDNGNLAVWADECYMPRLRTAYGLKLERVPFGFYEVVAALAPRAFFSCSPLRDDNFDVAGVKVAAEKASFVYQLLGAPDALQVRHPDCEHDFPEETRLEAYEFIDEVLGKKT